VAEAFKERDRSNQVVFVGSRKGLESKVVAREGYELKTIDAGALKGKGVWGKLRSLAAMPKSLWQSWMLLRSLRPEVVLGVGG
jgi:UDP-N-acetylglucosamine--N-acetylmuramyl-(pentapeptide) pyrophosphoryl-undecaprenol N-acetylglucosamine transferase